MKKLIMIITVSCLLTGCASFTDPKVTAVFDIVGKNGENGLLLPVAIAIYPIAVGIHAVANIGEEEKPVKKTSSTYKRKSEYTKPKKVVIKKVKKVKVLVTEEEAEKEMNKQFENWNN